MYWKKTKKSHPGGCFLNEKTKYEKITLEKDFSINLKKYNKNAYGIIFPNPNAPTGISIDYEKIKSFIRFNPKKLIMIELELVVTKK